MFVKNVFQLVKPFLAYLHSYLKHTLFVLFVYYLYFAYEYSKNAKFYADFKSVEIIGNK